MYNGWIPSISKREKLTNLIATCKGFIKDDPKNEYWKNKLLSAEIELEALNVHEWLGGGEVPQGPTVEELEADYLNHLDWKDEQATRESVRPY